MLSFSTAQKFVVKAISSHLVPSCFSATLSISSSYCASSLAPCLVNDLLRHVNLICHHVVPPHLPASSITVPTGTNCKLMCNAPPCLSMILPGSRIRGLPLAKPKRKKLWSSIPGENPHSTRVCLNHWQVLDYQPIGRPLLAL